MCSTSLELHAADWTMDFVEFWIKISESNEAENYGNQWFVKIVEIK